MTEYEIREDLSQRNWPFQVFNLSENRMEKSRFSKREDAQKWIDTIEEECNPNLYLFNAFFGDALSGTDTIIQLGSEEEALYNRQKAEREASYPVVVQPAPEPTLEEEAEFVGVAHKVGDEITDKDGNVYVAIQSSYYISGADAADLEDGWDDQVTIGWHTPARLLSLATEVIVEQIQTDKAKIIHREGKTCIVFRDEHQAVPLDDLAYSSELGLYRKSVFPEVK